MRDEFEKFKEKSENNEKHLRKQFELKLNEIKSEFIERGNKANDNFKEEIENLKQEKKDLEKNFLKEKKEEETKTKQRFSEIKTQYFEILRDKDIEISKLKESKKVIFIRNFVLI